MKSISSCLTHKENSPTTKVYSLLFITYYLIMTLCLASCGSSSKKQDKPAEHTHQPCPTFVADSAMAYIHRQCDFGPRLLGSEASRLCGDWIRAQFEKAGCTVSEQNVQVVVWDGSSQPCRNIIASTNPQAGKRVLLCAHWDTRPWADNDPDEDNHRTPVLGANDGASGVAVMLEIARQIQNQPMQNLGVDFVCFDAEDMGTPEWAEPPTDERNTWCLGSEAWALQASSSGYRPRYGILLDMVGGRGASFAKEQVSVHYASHVVSKVWNLAADLGYGQFFSPREGGVLMDDHVNVNRIAGIPCIDIVPYTEHGTSSFGPTWHTIHDTPENIDPAVLEAVGQTVLQLLYNEQ